MEGSSDTLTLTACNEEHSVAVSGRFAASRPCSLHDCCPPQESSLTLILTACSEKHSVVQVSRPVDSFMRLMKPGKPFERANWTITDHPDLFQPLVEDDIRCSSVGHCIVDAEADHNQALQPILTEMSLLSELDTRRAAVPQPGQRALCGQRIGCGAQHKGAKSSTKKLIVLRAKGFEGPVRLRHLQVSGLQLSVGTYTCSKPIMRQT